METIAVHYRPIKVGGISTGFYHKYIVYTDSNGNQEAARGGPDGGDSSGSDGNLNNDGNFGPIVTETGTYDSSFTDHPENPDRINDTGGNADPSETIAEDEDLSQEWEDILDAMDAIDAFLSGSKCNTFLFNVKTERMARWKQGNTNIYVRVNGI